MRTTARRVAGDGTAAYLQRQDLTVFASVGGTVTVVVEASYGTAGCG